MDIERKMSDNQSIIFLERNPHIIAESFLTLENKKMDKKELNITCLSNTTGPSLKIENYIIIRNALDTKRYLKNLLIEKKILDKTIICNINDLVGFGIFRGAGIFRKAREVRITGINYIPMLITNYDINELENKLSTTKNIEDAVELFAWMCKKQFFIDGNKRTALTVLNFILLKKGAGMIRFESNQNKEINKLLVDYYEKDNLESLQNYIVNNCIVYDTNGIWED